MRLHILLLDSFLFSITMHQEANHTLVTVNKAKPVVQSGIWVYYETTEWSFFILLSLTICFTSV